jgi:hypothetical protein
VKRRFLDLCACAHMHMCIKYYYKSLTLKTFGLQKLLTCQSYLQLHDKSVYINEVSIEEEEKGNQWAQNGKCGWHQYISPHTTCLQYGVVNI